VTRAEHIRRALLDRGGLLALVTLVVYIVLAPTHIVDGDNAEFSTLGTLGGTAHPTGYPLYLLWLRATSWLPGQSPAHTAALATAILGAASVLVLHAACRAWGAKPLSATIACAIYAGAPISIRIGIRAEVFALNCLVVAAILWLSATGGPLRGWQRALALGIVAGLGLSNHMTCVLIAPVGILGAIRGVRESSRASIAIAIGGLALGLLPYVYLLVTPDTAASWGSVRDLSDLFAMVTRRDYGGPGAFVQSGEDVTAASQVVALVSTLGRAWLWLPLALGWFAFGYHLAKPRDGETRWAWGLLAASWLLAGPILANRFNIAPKAMGLYVIQRFHQLPVLLMAVPVALGFDRIGALIRTRLGAHAAIVLVSTLGFAAAVGLSLPHLMRVNTPAVERYTQNVFGSLPPDAVMLAGQDDEYFGPMYVQNALGERRDVTLLAFHMSAFPWYAKRMMARGIYLPDGNEPPVVRIVEYLHAKQRPVFVSRQVNDVSRAIVKAFPTYIYGPVLRVLPRGTPVPSIDAILEENKRIFTAFRFGYPLPGEDDEFGTMIHQRYASALLALARRLEAAGKREDAAWAVEAARAIGPQP
jgi:Protein of unknown function (DUF2723)